MRVTSWLVLATVALGFCVSQGRVDRQYTAFVGDAVNLTCHTYLDIPVDWTFHGATTAEDIVHDGDVIDHWRTRGAYVSTTAPGYYNLIIPNVQLNDSGIFECVEDAGVGNSHSTYLNVSTKKETETQRTKVGRSKTTSNPAANSKDNAGGAQGTVRATWDHTVLPATQYFGRQAGMSNALLTTEDDGIHKRPTTSTRSLETETKRTKVGRSKTTSKSPANSKDNAGDSSFVILSLVGLLSLAFLFIGLLVFVLIRKHSHVADSTPSRSIEEPYKVVFRSARNSRAVLSGVNADPDYNQPWADAVSYSANDSEQRGSTNTDLYSQIDEISNTNTPYNHMDRQSMATNRHQSPSVYMGLRSAYQ